MPITRGQGNPDWTREETVLALDLLRATAPRVPGKTSAVVRELSVLLQRLPLHPQALRNDRFRNSEGVYLKLLNLASLRPDKGQKVGLSSSTMDRRVWAELATQPVRLAAEAELIRRSVAIIEAEHLELSEADESEDYPEGRMLTRIHTARERKRGLRAKVIASLRRRERFHCAACGARPRLPTSPTVECAEFEVHHVQPLALAVERRTTLADLALLCANCHRLIHALCRVRGTHVDVGHLRGELGVAVSDSETGANA